VTRKPVRAPSPDRRCSRFAGLKSAVRCAHDPTSQSRARCRRCGIADDARAGQRETSRRKARPQDRGAPEAPSKYGPNGFLPGYRQPLPLAEWRDRSPRHGGGDFSRDRRYWSGGEWRYGWGGAGFYRGRYNGGGFGPCWAQTPIGPMWNCGM